MISNPDIKNDTKSIEINRQLIHLLDDLLQAGNWEESLLLRTVNKQIHQLREKAEKLLQEATSIEHDQHYQAQEKAGFVKVFISLYQTDGNNLEKWHLTLKALSEYSISRPVYFSEEHVNMLIRSKADIYREAYVVVLVKPVDIIHLAADKTAKDRFGNELVTLKVSAIKLENIVEFVHGRNRYEYESEGLVLKDQLMVEVL